MARRIPKRIDAEGLRAWLQGRDQPAPMIEEPIPFPTPVTTPTPPVRVVPDTPRFQDRPEYQEAVAVAEEGLPPEDDPSIWQFPEISAPAGPMAPQQTGQTVFIDEPFRRAHYISPKNLVKTGMIPTEDVIYGQARDTRALEQFGKPYAALTDTGKQKISSVADPETDALRGQGTQPSWDFVPPSSMVEAIASETFEIVESLALAPPVWETQLGVIGPVINDASEELQHSPFLSFADGVRAGRFKPTPEQIQRQSGILQKKMNAGIAEYQRILYDTLPRGLRMAWEDGGMEEALNELGNEDSEKAAEHRRLLELLRDNKIEETRIFVNLAAMAMKLDETPDEDAISVIEKKPTTTYRRRSYVDGEWVTEEVLRYPDAIPILTEAEESVLQDLLNESPDARVQLLARIMRNSDFANGVRYRLRKWLYAQQKTKPPVRAFIEAGYKLGLTDSPVLSEPAPPSTVQAMLGDIALMTILPTTEEIWNDNLGWAYIIAPVGGATPRAAAVTGELARGMMRAQMANSAMKAANTAFKLLPENDQNLLRAAAGVEETSNVVTDFERIDRVRAPYAIKKLTKKQKAKQTVGKNGAHHIAPSRTANRKMHAYSPGAQVFGATPIPLPLTPAQMIRNIAKTTISSATGGRINIALTTPHADAIKRLARNMDDTTDSQATRLAEKLSVSRDIFSIGKDGTIKAFSAATLGLRGAGAPTLQDLAARFPLYRKYMSKEQLEFMRDLRDEARFFERILRVTFKRNKMPEGALEEYRVRLGKGKDAIGKRKDIMENGGFYLPRGGASKRGVAAIGKSDFTANAVFDSMWEAMNNGYVYKSAEQALAEHMWNIGRSVKSATIADYLRNARDEAGNLLGISVKEFLENSPKYTKYVYDDGKVKSIVDISAKMANLRRILASVGRLVDDLDDSQQDVINRFIHDIDFDNFDQFDEVVRALHDGYSPARLRALLTVKRVGETAEAAAEGLAGVARKAGKYRGLSPSAARAFLKELKKESAEFKPIYEAALEDAKDFLTKGESGLTNMMIGNLPQLNGISYADELAKAVMDVIQPPAKGRAGQAADAALETVAAFNQLWRGIKATLDNSGPGIHGLLGLADNQAAYGRALQANLRAFLPSGVKVPLPGGRTMKGNGQRVLGQYIIDFDKRQLDLRKKGFYAPSSRDLVSEGLHLGGANTEFLVGRGITAGLQTAIGFRQANRAFGFFGDTLRLEWASDLIRTEAAMGRSADLIRRSGDLRRITNITNAMTGWQSARFAGSMGDLLLFAPRFLQARLTTVTQAALGLLPGASLSQRTARNTMLRFIGGGVMLTESINQMLGNETDYRMLVKVKGKWQYNSNFVRIRWGGRDWSLFGTYDGLLRAIVSTSLATKSFNEGDISASSQYIQGAYRGMAAGTPTLAWDLMSDETFIGKSVSHDYKRWLLEQTVPFAYQDIFESTWPAYKRGEYTQATASLVGAMVGAKSSELSLSDVRDIASIETHGVRYAELDKGEKREIDATERVQQELQEYKEKIDADARREALRSDPDVLSHKWDMYRNAKESGELSIAELIERNRPLEEIGNEIKRVKLERAILADKLFNDTESAIKKDKEKLQDILAEKYWSIELEGDIVHGVETRDFDSFREQRESVLAQADSFNIPRSYITGTGLGTFRGIRFEDKAVRDIVLEYEADKELLREYWDVWKQVSYPDDDVMAAWEEFNESPSRTNQNTVYDDNPEISVLVSELRDLRNEMRTIYTDDSSGEVKRKEAIDIALVKWRSNYSAMTIAGQSVKYKEEAKSRMGMEDNRVPAR